MSPRPAWATLWIQGWSEPHSEMPSKEKKKDEKRRLVAASSSWWNVYWKSIQLPHPTPAAISSLGLIFFTLQSPLTTPLNLPQTIRGLQCTTLVLSSGLFGGSHADSWLLFPLSQSSCFQQTCIIGNDFSHHLCVNGFQCSPVLPPASHCDPRSSALCTSDLLPRASFCHVSLLLQTPAAFVLLWCLRETYAKSPVTLSAGYWLHFKNMMVKLQPRSNWQLCLGGHLRVNGLLLWPWC